MEYSGGKCVWSTVEVSVWSRVEVSVYGVQWK